MADLDVKHSVISERENREIEAANASGNTPVVFIHGLWLLPSSWANWADFFKQAGYAPVTPDWPDDPATVDEAREHPDVLAKKTLKQVADHTTEVIKALDTKPVVMGHSTGGLLAQILAGQGLSAVTVAIDPGVFRGVLPLPASVLSELRVEQLVAAPRAVVYRYFTEAEKWSEWQGESATVDPRPGGRFSLVMSNGQRAEGEFVELEPGLRVVFTWGWVGHPDLPPGSTWVEIVLAEEPAGTRVVLTHRLLPDDELERHREGWTMYLPRLAEVAAPTR